MAFIVHCEKKIFRSFGKELPCAIGKNGYSQNKTEGDGKTPLGIFPLRRVWYRKDRVILPPLKIAAREILPQDGWCDDPSDARYNLRVALPYAARHENLWREDGAYDLFVEIGYNDDPVIPGKGSAIFLHCEVDGFKPTEGCVALKKEDLIGILPQLDADSRIDIRA